MMYSDTIPADVIPFLRIGSRALTDIREELLEADRRVFVERHLDQEVRPLLACRERHVELLDLIGWTGKDNTEAVEMPPGGQYLGAIQEAIERFELDYPGEGTQEIGAFCLAVGVRFKKQEGAV